MTDLLTLHEQYASISKEQFKAIGRTDFDSMIRVADRIRHGNMNFFALLSQCDEELAKIKNQFARNWTLKVAGLARAKMLAEWNESPDPRNTHLEYAIELAAKYQ